MSTFVRSYDGDAAHFPKSSSSNIEVLYGPIYTVRLCRMRQAYDRLTTRIVSCKSNLQLTYDS